MPIPDRPAPVPRSSGAAAIAVTYLVLAAAWIFLSDVTLQHFLGISNDRLTHLQTLKGCLFVAATAGLIYLLIRRRLLAIDRTTAALEASERHHRLLFEASPVPM